MATNNSSSRFGWKNKKASTSIPPRRRHIHPQEPIRSAYFPEDDEDDDTSSCWEGEGYVSRPSMVTKRDHEEAPSFVSEASAVSSRRGRSKKVLSELDHLQYHSSECIARREAGEGGAEEAKPGDEYDMEGDDDEEEEEEEKGTSSPACCKKKVEARRGERIYFGDVRFPASRSVLWPRQASGQPIFASSSDTTAPLLLLRTGPLRALHARLFQQEAAAAGGGGGGAEGQQKYRKRGTWLKTLAYPTTSIRTLPPSLARTLLRPPPVTLVLQDEEAGSGAGDDDHNPLPLMEAPSVVSLMPQLLDGSIQGSSSKQQGSKNYGANPARSKQDPWEMLLPVVEMAVEAASSTDGPMTEADYRAIMTWATKLLSHPPRGSLSFATAMTPMRLLVSATAPDTLRVRAERILPCLSIRFTPLEPLPALNTSLWARLMERPQSPSEAGPQTGYLTLNDARRVVTLLNNDPLVQERPLVGIWVTGLGDDWTNDVHRHPFLWAAILRYVLTEELSERVTVEPHTILLAWFGSVPSSPPTFFECKLLWPSIPAVPGQAQPLAFRILDFSADVSWEVEEDPTTAGGGGRRQRHRGHTSSSDPPAADDWLNLVVGHFKETSCPPIASSFYRAQRLPGTKGHAAMDAERETISALTFESHQVSPLTGPLSSISPSLRKAQQQRRQQEGSLSSPTRAKKKEANETERENEEVKGQMNEEEEEAVSAFSVRSALGLVMPGERDEGQSQAIGGGGGGGADGKEAAATVAAQAYQLSATKQLVLAQQQHLHQLQRQVRELEARLARATTQPDVRSVSISIQEEWASALPPLPPPSTTRPSSSEPAAAKEGQGGGRKGEEKMLDAKAAFAAAEGKYREDSDEDDDEELQEVSMLKAPSWESGPVVGTLRGPATASQEAKSISSTPSLSSSLHADPDAKGVSHHFIPNRLAELSPRGNSPPPSSSSTSNKRQQAKAEKASPNRKEKHEVGGEGVTATSLSSPMSSPQRHRNAEELGLPTIERPPVGRGRDEDEELEDEDCLSKAQTTLSLDLPRIVYDDLPTHEGGPRQGNSGDAADDDDSLDTESIIQIEARYLKMMKLEAK